MTLRLSKVDELVLETGHHAYLAAEDQCYFLGEYTARAGFAHSETNQLVLNFKIKPEHRGKSRWYYKENAVRKAAILFGRALSSRENVAALTAATLVPIPPSKARDDPQYDERVLWLLRELAGVTGIRLDIRELLIQPSSADSFHDLANRPRPDELASRYSVDEQFANPTPRAIWLFDDTLTTGCHFKAAQLVLSSRFAGITIAGFFIARRVPGSTDPDEEATGATTGA